MMNPVFLLHPDDDVAVAVTDLAEGQVLAALDVFTTQVVPRGHKVATRGIAEGMPVKKYGQVIGHARVPIAAGEHVHTHNLGMSEHTEDYAHGEMAIPTMRVPEAELDHFLGFRRGDGKSGTRNYVGIISSVNCSATVAQQVVREVERRELLKEFPHVDGVVAITHGVGCCISQRNEAFAMLQRTVWGHVRHPNFGAVMMVGLGCETNQIPGMVEAFGKPPEGQLHFLTIQQMGGTRRTIEACLEKLQTEVLPAADRARREKIPASELIIALQCGGSDGLSGITANPALGLAVDRLVAQGGSAILAETPEIYGAEHLLTRRAVRPEVGEALIERIRWWEDYAAKLDGEINNNPTPGNKAGGLTTILEKSLGAVCKAGSTNLVSVLRYAEPVKEPGMHLMDSPGYDPMSITGEVASGATLVAFTTGRGSVYGYKPSPVIKIATNSPMFRHMEEDMDLNAGTIAEGLESHEEVAERIYQEFLRVASGAQTKSEALGFGDAEFVPWNISAQM
ncbi:altronate hydrolase [Haloferula luteola]|uniref:Altronate hydrolase n=1 Tax=Haloferula luteola TaxID=595692 RepID=A0A840V6M3_9BACT|nr:altronate dehydratase family protein [Haloferula luteola]MBB5350418.1 altronate hydrolase [Haloferula luteola]